MTWMTLGQRNLLR